MSSYVEYIQRVYSLISGSFDDILFISSSGLIPMNEKYAYQLQSDIKLIRKFIPEETFDAEAKRVLSIIDGMNSLEILESIGPEVFCYLIEKIRAYQC